MEISGFFIRKARWMVPRLEQISRLDIWPICFYENLHIISRVVEIDESLESFEFNSGSQSHIPMLFQQRPLTPEVQPENESSTRRDFQKNTFSLDSRPYCSSLLLLVIRVENKNLMPPNSILKLRLWFVSPKTKKSRTIWDTFQKTTVT